MSYLAVVLSPYSRNLLFDTFRLVVPNNWTKYCHHMTIGFGLSSEDKRFNNLLFEREILTVNSFSINQYVCAVKVSFDDQELKDLMSVYMKENTKHKFPHITIAVNKNNGGKPIRSNDLDSFIDTEPFTLEGTIQIVQ